MTQKRCQLRQPEILDGKRARDRRQLWPFEFRRPFIECVGESDQGGAGEQEEAAEENGEPETGGPARQAEP